MSETHEPNERRHAEDPAEGADQDAQDETPADRTHAEQPAEGATPEPGRAQGATTDGGDSGGAD